jgi:histidinol dehydrogenase
MTAIPARVAGVERVIVCTPPKRLTAEVLAAAALAGVDEIYRIGGPAAIGAMAYGTKTVKAVDLIVGPGGAWVTEAKRLVFGRVGLDMLAGPSEIVVVAGRGAPPRAVAADLMAQAEHDPLARAIVVSPDARLLAAAREAVHPSLKRQCRFEKVRDILAAVERANQLAPEHLSLMVPNPERWVSRVNNAGAVFLGSSSPVAAGDYWAGPSHVLPTAGSARFSSGLSVGTFLKRTSVIGLSPEALRRAAPGIARFAAAEGLSRHAASVQERA